MFPIFIPGSPLPSLPTLPREEQAPEACFLVSGLPFGADLPGPTLSVERCLVLSAAESGYHKEGDPLPVEQWNRTVWWRFVEAVERRLGPAARRACVKGGMRLSPITFLEWAVRRHDPADREYLRGDYGEEIRRATAGWSKSRWFEAAARVTQEALLLDVDTPADIQEELVEGEGIWQLERAFPEVDWEALAEATVLPP